MGARSMGLGNASTCLSDVWAIHNNIAGLSEVNAPASAVSLHSIPSLAFMNRMAAAIAVPVGSLRTGLGIFRFGDDLYNEHVVTMGAAHEVGLASLGVRLNYVQYRADGAGTRMAISAGFGGIAELVPGFRVGAHILHINQPLIDEAWSERLPARMAAGIAWVTLDKMHLTAEIEKEAGFPSMIRTGMEYRFLDKVAFRTGFQLNPDNAFFGTGFTAARLRIDYALQLNSQYYVAHQATVQLFFRKK